MKKTIINIDPSLSREAEQNVNLVTNVVTKHSILFGTAVFINQGFYAVLIYNHFTKNFNDPITFISLPFEIRAIENVANVLILWLILRINYDRYITLCKYCHLCVGKCCFKNVNHRVSIDNPYSRLSDL